MRSTGCCRRGETVETFAIAVPVSCRPARDGAALGNAVSPMLVTVPGTGDVTGRLARVATRVRAAKAVAAGPPPIAVLGALFRSLAALGGYRWYLNHRHRMHTLVSHVRGPAEPVTFGGVPVRAAIPLSVGESGNPTVLFEALSYDGRLAISMLADPVGCPDLDVLVDGLAAELALVGWESRWDAVFRLSHRGPRTLPRGAARGRRSGRTEVTMTTSLRTRRPPARTRLAGYFAGVVVNGILLVLINGRPGWAAVPFLTAGFSSVAGVVDLALVAGLVTGFVHLWHDPEWLVALDGVVTTCAGLVALVRIWQVFPLDFGESSFDWAATARIVLAVGIAGSVLGLLAGLVNLVKAGRRHGPAGGSSDE